MVRRGMVRMDCMENSGIFNTMKSHLVNKTFRSLDCHSTTMLRLKQTNHSQEMNLGYLQYDVMSISCGSSPMFTSNLSWTSFKTLASVSSDTKVIARPFVPNLPARATWRKVIQDDIITMFGDVSLKQCFTYPVQVCIRVLRHVIIEHNIDTFNVHPSTKEICCHQDTFLEIFELLIPW